MNDIREIVTKAVIAKGKKRINLEEVIKLTEIPEAILGCLVINHQFEAIKQNQEIKLKGQFELNIWYSNKNNSNTNIIKKIIKYEQDINTKRILNNELNKTTDCIVKILQHPSCTNALIENDECKVDIMFEVLVDVIGEVTMQVNIIDNFNVEISDIDEIDEDFLK